MSHISNQIISFEGDQYAIPQENLKELVRIPAAEVKDKIDKVGSLPVVRLRQEFLPLLELPDVLGVPKTYLDANGEERADRRKQVADRRAFQHITEKDSDEEDQRAFIERQESDRRTSHKSAINIAIVHSEGYKYGLVVDKFHDSEELEILPAGRYLTESDVYLGTTILKNEKPALVLDIFKIAHSIGLSQTAEKIEGITGESVTNEDPDLDYYSLLTFKNADSEHFAVDLDSVDRLERFDTSKFEKIGSEEVIQYREGALPLFELSQVMPASALPETEIQEIIVFKHNGVLGGLKIAPPVDTYEGRLSLDISTFNTPPVSGSLIINRNTTLLLDVPAMIEKINGRSNK